MSREVILNEVFHWCSVELMMWVNSQPLHLISQVR